MRLLITKTKNNEFFYIIESTYIDGVRSSKTVERLGTFENVKSRANGVDPYVWAKEYAKELTEKDKDNKLSIIKYYSQNKLLELDKQNLFNGGYLFLQSIYYSLGLDDICKEISERYQFKYDLNNILSNLLYARVINPASKLKTFDITKTFLEQQEYKIDDLYRSLDVIANETDYIQSELYKNSLKFSKRNDRVLFYDCTNYYFEIEEDDDFRKYGKSKENRPNPVVGMGLFLDGDGIPLAFSLFPGNTNEQVTLKPLEKKIINDFEHSKFVVCTDAGLSSSSNRLFNNIGDRFFITTQSLKKVKPFIREWALDLEHGWKLSHKKNKTYNILDLKKNKELAKQYSDVIFYKERWIKENGLEQRLIVTYSPKYQLYQQAIRERQVLRAHNIISKNPKQIVSKNQNDPKRFIKNIASTYAGEVADKNNYFINQELILNESQYDGFYAVCTNLEDDVEEIININKQRWQIEDSFRLMKTEFKARPVYLSKENRIKAHFTTCFLALVLFRYLESKLEKKHTAKEIIETLRTYKFMESRTDYIPTYKRSELTDMLHEKFDFRTDYEINSNKNIQKIIKQTKTK